MKQTLIVLLMCTIIFACKKKTTVTQGADLTGKTSIYAYNDLEGSLNEPIEYYEDNGNILSNLNILIGPTPSFQGWSISKGVSGYKIVAKEFPTYCLDASTLPGTNLMGTFNKNTVASQEWIFEQDATTANVYYMKNTDGRYFVFDGIDIIMKLNSGKPVEDARSVCRWKIK